MTAGRIGVLSVAAVMSIGAAVAASAQSRDSGRVVLTQALKRTSLVFPFDVPTTISNRDEVRLLLSDMAASRLMLTNSYTVVQFHKNLPPVARLHLDQQLTDGDVSEPFAEDTTKASKIGKLTGYDVVFIGSVDDYQYNAGDKSADVVLSGRLIDVKTGKAVSTPVTLKGSSTKGGMAKEGDRALEAARNGASQLLAKLIPITNTVTETPVQAVVKTAPKKKKNNDWIWGLLAVGLGLGIGMAASGGHGGGGNDDKGRVEYYLLLLLLLLLIERQDIYV